MFSGDTFENAVARTCSHVLPHELPSTRENSDRCCLLDSKFYNFGLIPVYSPEAAAISARLVYSKAVLLDGELPSWRANRSEHN